MDTFDKIVQFQRDLIQSQLKVIYGYQQELGQTTQQPKRTSQLDIVEDILSLAQKPLHVSEIMETAKKEYQITLERDSIVSALIKKVQAGKRFKKTGPNTFSLETFSGRPQI